MLYGMRISNRCLYRHIARYLRDVCEISVIASASVDGPFHARSLYENYAEAKERIRSRPHSTEPTPKRIRAIIVSHNLTAAVKLRRTEAREETAESASTKLTAARHALCFANVLQRTRRRVPRCLINNRDAPISIVRRNWAANEIVSSRRRRE